MDNHNEFKKEENEKPEIKSRKSDIGVVIGVIVAIFFGFFVFFYGLPNNVSRDSLSDMEFNFTGDDGATTTAESSDEIERISDEGEMDVDINE